MGFTGNLNGFNLKVRKDKVHMTLYTIDIDTKMIKITGEI